MIFGRNKVAEELKTTNLYLALIAEILQNPPPVKRMAVPPTKVSERAIAKIDFPPAFVDAMELLARRLWIDLPAESKEDLTP